MTDPAAPTTPEPYGVPETIAHWRRQADLCDSDVESAAFIHCARLSPHNRETDHE